jgi:uncharacterized protein (DUF1684 family)
MTTQDRGALARLIGSRIVALSLVMLAAACTGTSDETARFENSEGTPTTAVTTTELETSTTPTADYADAVLDAEPLAYWPLDDPWRRSPSTPAPTVSTATIEGATV